MKDGKKICGQVPQEDHESVVRSSGGEEAMIMAMVVSRKGEAFAKYSTGKEEVLDVERMVIGDLIDLLMEGEGIKDVKVVETIPSCKALPKFIEKPTKMVSVFSGTGTILLGVIYLFSPPEKAKA
jgi:hypothetical protein